MSAGVATAKAADVQVRQQDDAAEQMQVDTAQVAAAEGDEDLYTKLKTLQRQLEFLEIQVSLLAECRPVLVLRCAITASLAYKSRQLLLLGQTEGFPGNTLHLGRKRFGDWGSGC